MLPIRISLSKTARGSYHWLAAGREDGEQEIPRSFGGLRGRTDVRIVQCNGNLSS